MMDMMEKLYLAGFPVLLAFVSLFPAYMSQRGDASGAAGGDKPSQGEAAGSALEFLPLMVTSVYCALGIVWGYLRLLFIYLNEERTYQGQLSTIR